MRMQLVPVCVILVVAVTALAADPPKGKPTTPPPVEVGKGGLGNLGIGKPSDDTKFVVTRPVGTWYKDVRLEDLSYRIVLTIREDRLTVAWEMTDGKERVTFRLDADYAINKEGSLFGVIDTFENDHPQFGELPESQKLSGQPYSFRFRADESSLSLKEFKGFGIGWSSGEPPSGLKRVLAGVCGRYTAVDPAKPLPVLKAVKPKVYSSDPLIRQDQLLNQSEVLRLIGETWWQIWEKDTAGKVTPGWIGNGIVDTPPKDKVRQVEGRSDVPVVWPAPFPSSSGSNIPPVPNVPPLPLKLPLPPDVETLKVDVTPNSLPEMTRLSSWSTSFDRTPTLTVPDVPPVVVLPPEAVTKLPSITVPPLPHDQPLQQVGSWQIDIPSVTPRPMPPPAGPPPERVQGGALKADPVKECEGQGRFFETWRRWGWLPVQPNDLAPWRIQHGIFDECPLPTSAYVGSVSGAVATLRQRDAAEVMRAVHELRAEPVVVPQRMREK